MTSLYVRLDLARQELVSEKARAVSCFVERFDRGDYPDLDLEEK